MKNYELNEDSSETLAFICFKFGLQKFQDAIASPFEEQFIVEEIKKLNKKYILSSTKI